MSSIPLRMPVVAELFLLAVIAGRGAVLAATGDMVESPSQAERSSFSLAARATDFMNSYWEKVSGDSAEVLAYLGSTYAPVVSYYGNPTPRNTVLKEKSNFIRRWPLRRTWPSATAEGPRVSCDPGTAECEIKGVRDYEAVSAERHARSVGVVYYSYRVRFLDGSAQIVGENSEAVRSPGIR